MACGVHRWQGMARSRRQHVEIPFRLYSLSEDHKYWLRKTADPEGLYCFTYNRIQCQLIEAGLVEEHAKHVVSDTTRSVHDDRPCEYTERTLHITAEGRRMLGVLR